MTDCTVTPRDDERSLVDIPLICVTALFAAAIVGMMIRTMTVMLPVVIVSAMLRDSAPGMSVAMLSIKARCAVASKASTVPARPADDENGLVLGARAERWW